MNTPFRFADLTFRAKLTYTAHLFKAVMKRHHSWLGDFFSRFIDPDSVVLDIGGHSGQYAKEFARLVPNGRVYSFEPGSYPRSILKRALQFNGLRHVEVVGKGLGREPGTLTLVTPLKPNGIYRFGLAYIGTAGEPPGSTDASPATDTPLSVSEDVPVTTIDAFFRESGAERLDLIKMDVEGWEAQILKGGAETIQRFQPTLLLELVASQLARAGDDLQETWAMLLGWGYKPYLHAPGHTLVPQGQPLDGDSFWIHESRLPPDLRNRSPLPSLVPVDGQFTAASETP